MNRSLSVGYLRAFITVLVILHHAVLAYHPFAPASGTSFLAEPRLWLVFPVSDSAKTGASLFITGVNDVFFMSLMFLVSGLFVWRSLTRKGVSSFLRDRASRLGVPFLLSVILLAPAAYFPGVPPRNAVAEPRGLRVQVAAAGWTASGSGMVSLGPAGVRRDRGVAVRTLAGDR